MNGFNNQARSGRLAAKARTHPGPNLALTALVGLLALLLAALVAPLPAQADDGATLAVTPAGPRFFCGESIDVTYTYNPDLVGTPELRGYSIRVVAPYGLAFDATDITVYSPLVGVNDTHMLIANGPYDFNIDFTFLDPGAALTEAADLFTITYHDRGFNVPNRPVGVDSGRFRNLQNQDITVDLSASPLVSVVCVAPDPPPIMDPLPEYSPGSSVTVSWADAAWTGAVAYLAKVSTDPAFGTVEAESGWITGLSYEFTGLTDGVLYYFKVQARNGTGMVSRDSNIEHTTQDGTPPVTSPDPLDPTQYLVEFDIPFQATDDLSGFAQLEFFYRFDGGSWVDFGSYSESPVAFAAVDGDGLYEFYTVGTDVAGNVEATPVDPQASTTLDTSAPYGGFTINADAVATKSVNVALFVDVIRADEMRFSNDGVNWPGGWVPLSALYPWTIPATEQVHTVYGEFRDAALQVLATTDDIEYDVTPPGPVTDPTAAPGHETVFLSWTNPVDPDFHQVEIWRGLLHDGSGNSTYPSYIGSTAPTPPADRNAALVSSEWTLAGMSEVGASSFIDSVDTRGVYYYQFFAIDPAVNYSAPAGSTPRATNYILGDVAEPVDGVVGVGDMTLMASTYGLVGFDPLFIGSCDVGPTDDGLGTGIPQPDDQINLEDQMIFGMNYLPTAKNETAPPSGQAPIVSLAWNQTGGNSWELVLKSPCPRLKGVGLAADLPTGVIAEVQPGPALASLADPYFLKNIDDHGLDAGLVVLGRGRGLDVGGTLLTVTCPSNGEAATPPLSMINLDLRDLDNRALEFELAGKSQVTPAVFALGEAFPNPFNPATTIRFSIPGESAVRLEIYGLDGRLVSVLVDNVLPGGAHEAVWLGRDESGRQVASGVYFSRLSAGSHSQVRKLTLMK